MLPLIIGWKEIWKEAGKRYGRRLERDMEGGSFGTACRLRILPHTITHTYNIYTYIYIYTRTAHRDQSASCAERASFHISRNPGVTRPPGTLGSRCARPQGDLQHALRTVHRPGVTGPPKRIPRPPRPPRRPSPPAPLRLRPGPARIRLCGRGRAGARGGGGAGAALSARARGRGPRPPPAGFWSKL